MSKSLNYCADLLKHLGRLKERQAERYEETNDERTTGNDISLSNLEIKLDMVQKEKPFTSV